MKRSDTLTYLANLPDWIDVLDLPKKINEGGAWIAEHPLLAGGTLVALAAGSWLLLRPKIYFITKRGHLWVHHPLEGDVIGKYSSRSKAIEGATAYHQGRGRAVLYILDSNGEVYDQTRF
jgi:hypothetical protein